MEDENEKVLEMIVIISLNAESSLGVGGEIPTSSSQSASVRELECAAASVCPLVGGMEGTGRRRGITK
ncbi:hypothetical protein EYF80_036010 [Liparis tanakae]|uniref:Uncharacterized protein n=1 Tax=Liparis tanakae TaxID=230148 RepID=A0A4Z2GLT0_9TELE|nr:hypothetical protein EYF80_036010 [Liparis tanakae]